MIAFIKRAIFGPAPTPASGVVTVRAYTRRPAVNADLARKSADLHLELWWLV